MSSTTGDGKISVLFVCLGNICRSTMAEGTFHSVVKNGPYSKCIGRIDSCGTGDWHVGDGPDERTMATLRSKGITDYMHRARQFRSTDLDQFDYVLAMDESNLNALRNEKKRKPDAKAQVMLFGKYADVTPVKGEGEVVQDPFYGGSEGFVDVYEQVRRFSENFLRATFPAVEG